MRVLVCGGRGYDDARALGLELDAAHEFLGFSALLHGGARGADLLAHAWAGRRGIAREVYKADWLRYGRRAGPLRNARMLAEGRPDLVIAFAGGAGTADMVRRATEAGVVVLGA